MHRTFKRAKQELGKACSVASVGIIVAIFVTTKITGKQLELGEIFVCILIGILLLIASFILLSENIDKPLPGKWKRVKVKKDTTIHIEENE